MFSFSDLHELIIGKGKGDCHNSLREIVASKELNIPFHLSLHGCEKFCVCLGFAEAF